MVMGKVSKAIAASFLCLSLFSASGDFASAMKDTTFNNSGNLASAMGGELKSSTTGNMSGKEIEREKEKEEEKDNIEDKKDEGKKDTPTPGKEKKGLSEKALRVIIGVFSGAGGLAVGTILGKVL